MSELIDDKNYAESKYYEFLRVQAMSAAFID